MIKRKMIKRKTIDKTIIAEDIREKVYLRTEKLTSQQRREICDKIKCNHEVIKDGKKIDDCPFWKDSVVFEKTGKCKCHLWSLDPNIEKFLDEIQKEEKVKKTRKVTICSSCGNSLCPTCGGCQNGECKDSVNLCRDVMKGLTVKERKHLTKFGDKSREELLEIIRQMKKIRETEPESKAPSLKKMRLDKVLEDLSPLIEGVSKRWNISEERISNIQKKTKRQIKVK